MKRSVLGALIALTTVGAQAMVNGGGKTSSNKIPEAVSGEFVVKFKGAANKSTQQELASLGLKITEEINSKETLFRVKSSAVKGTSEMLFRESIIAAVSALPQVEYIEPNYIYRASYIDQPEVIPNDASFNALWGMKNTGQADADGVVGKVGSDIKATQAWALHRGSKNVVVAVIDTGVDYTHPELKANIWSKAGAPEAHGYNAITGALNPMDDHGHGTHCSGTIGASGDNGAGVVGVAWDVSLMGVKFLSSSGSGTLADAIKAIDWAVANGAQILSNSWGGGGFSQALMDAISRANDKGILFIAAAGNDGRNNDGSPSYPASYNVPNVVSVAASTNLDTVADFSNFGLRSVHLMAPGHNILSTVTRSRFDTYSGTSMATPHVSGAAALLWAKEPSLTALEIKQRLMDSADKLKGIRRRIASAGRLNLYNLLTGVTIPGFAPIPDSAWSQPVAHPIASAHPYGNSVVQRWEIEHPGATHIRVRFAKFRTEPGYDTLKITGADGEVVDTLSGVLADNTWTLEVEGSKAILEFKTDSSISDFGFEIDAYSWANVSQ